MIWPRVAQHHRLAPLRPCRSSMLFPSRGAFVALLGEPAACVVAQAPVIAVSALRHVAPRHQAGPTSGTGQSTLMSKWGLFHTGASGGDVRRRSGRASLFSSTSRARKALPRPARQYEGHSAPSAFLSPSHWPVDQRVASPFPPVTTPIERSPHRPDRRAEMPAQPPGIGVREGRGRAYIPKKFEFHPMPAPTASPCSMSGPKRSRPPARGRTYGLD